MTLYRVTVFTFENTRVRCTLKKQSCMYNGRRIPIVDNYSKQLNNVTVLFTRTIYSYLCTPFINGVICNGVTFSWQPRKTLRSSLLYEATSFRSN